MPIFEQGYQHWQGKLSGHTWRWLTITRHGVRAQFANRWLRLVILLAWVPAFGLAAFLVFWGLVEQQSSLVTPLLTVLLDPKLALVILNDPHQFRATVWTIAYRYFFQFEVFFSMILVLLVGPSLISQDLRFNAIPLYFSRPMRRWDYFVGKLGAIAVYLAAVAIVPALLAYVLGLCFSLDLTVVRDTLRVLGGGLAYGLVVVVSAGTLMLALSALSRNARYVGAFWVGLWLVSNMAAAVLGRILPDEEWCPLVSYTANLDRLNGELLDSRRAFDQVNEKMEELNLVSANPRRRLVVRMTPKFSSGPEFPWYWSAGVLTGLFGLSLWILTSRVRSLDRLR
jgi:ABC-2 type transport system permease protein